MDEAKSGRPRQRFLSPTPKRKWQMNPADQTEVYNIDPVPTTTYTPGSSVDFNVITGSYAMRMLDNPIQVKYIIEEKEGEDWKSGKFDAQSGYWAPSDILGAATFIASTSVSLNNVTLTADTEPYANYYMGIQARMCNPETRRQLLGKHAMYNSLKERKDDVTAMGALFQSGNCTDGHKIINGSVPHAFLGPPKNLVVEDILGQNPSNNHPELIPPDSQVIIRFVLEDKLWKRFVQLNLEPTAYFGTKEPSDAAALTTYKKSYFPIARFRVRILGMRLMATKMQWGSNTDTQKSLMSNPITHERDIAKTSHSTLPAGLGYHTTAFTLPKETPAAFITFPSVVQSHGDRVGEKTSDCTAYTLPADLTKIVLRVNGSLATFPNGLVIDDSKPNSSSSMMLYYTYLCRLGLVDDPFEVWCPITNDGLNNIFLIDMTNMQKQSENINVQVEVWFKTASPAGYQIACTSCSEGEMSRLKNKSWQSNATSM